MRTNIFGMILTVIFLTGIAQAQTSSFGLGLTIGEPTGISAKLMQGNQNSSINLAAAWSVGPNDHLYLKGDYVWYNNSILNADPENGRLPVYYGLGAMAVLVDDENGDGDSILGVRIPFGIDYFSDEIPFDFFLEIVPVIELLPSTDFSLSGGIGFHYFF